MDAETKLAEGSHVTCAKGRHLSLNSLTSGFCKKLFNKIDAGTSYLGDASVKYHLPLRGRFWRRIRHLYSELEVIKACGKGENSLSWHHFITEATSPVRDVIKNKNKADHSSS